MNEKMGSGSMAIEIAGPSAFWSYVHLDDEASQKKISHLAERVKGEFLLQTGETLDLFRDEDKLLWGDTWRARLEAAVQQTVFFIPIVTPLYLKSQECRSEFLQFMGEARRIHAPQLLLPILFVPVELAEHSDDEVEATIAKTQYEDWSELRLVDENSEDYNRGLHRMATRLADISRAYWARPTLTPSELVSSRADSQGYDSDTHVASDSHVDSTSDFEDEAPGVADRIAELEEAMPAWQETLDQFPLVARELGDAATEATEKMSAGERQGKTFGYRVLVVREMAKQLAAPSERMRVLGDQYASGLLDLDPGVRAMIQLAGEDDRTSEEVEAACGMFRGLKGLVSASRGNAQSLKGLDDSLRIPAKQFKDLRAPLSKVNRGLQSILDAQTVLEEWDRLIDESPIDCSDFTSNGS